MLRNIKKGIHFFPNSNPPPSCPNNWWQLRKLNNRTLSGTPMTIVLLTVSFKIFMACRLLFQTFKKRNKIAEEKDGNYQSSLNGGVKDQYISVFSFEGFP